MKSYFLSFFNDPRPKNLIYKRVLLNNMGKLNMGPELVSDSYFQQYFSTKIFVI